jgi:hypothetical protein
MQCLILEKVIPLCVIFIYLTLTCRYSDVCKRHTNRCLAVASQPKNYRLEEEWGSMQQAIANTVPSFTAPVESAGFSTIPEKPRNEQIVFPAESPQAYSASPMYGLPLWDYVYAC